MQSLARWKRLARENWEHFRSAPAGKRFERYYREQKEADKGRSKLSRWLKPILAVFSFAIGVVLAVIPGPAVLFFGISLMLVASKSLRIARGLDRLEVWGREQWLTLRKRFGHKHQREAQ